MATSAHDNIRATASFAIGRYREGINFARSAASYIPNSPSAHRALIINLAFADKFGEVRQEVQTLKRAFRFLRQPNRPKPPNAGDGLIASTS